MPCVANGFVEKGLEKTEILDDRLVADQISFGFFWFFI